MHDSEMELINMCEALFTHQIPNSEPDRYSGIQVDGQLDIVATTD
jgi:hypothetical protein